METRTGYLRTSENEGERGGQIHGARKPDPLKLHVLAPKVFNLFPQSSFLFPLTFVLLLEVEWFNLGKGAKELDLGSGLRVS